METQADAMYAAVQLGVNLPHLDRLFEYRIPSHMLSEAAPGVRVRVRFAGRLVDGFIVSVSPEPTHDGKLADVHKVVSPEPVLSPTVHHLLRLVSDHYAGTVADVIRFAIPPRHAATEKAQRKPPAHPRTTIEENALQRYPAGEGYLHAISDGRRPRACWQVAAVHSALGNPFGGLVAAAQAAIGSGRGAIIVVPHQRDLDRLIAEVTSRCGPGSFAILAADVGPSARYRHFLAASRGLTPLVIGTRAAIYAPVKDLGFIGIWDDGSDDYSESHAPYPHTREVAAIRATQMSAALLVASYSRSSEVQSWVNSQWVHDIAFRPAQLRASTPVVRIAAATDFAVERDPYARQTRLPHEVFDVVRAGLAAGPVLVQVPLSGYVRSIICADCGSPATCPRCSGRLHRGQPPDDTQLRCAWCGPLMQPWTCPSCGGHRTRALAVGSARTAEELGRAFPGTRVRTSSADKIVEEVDDESALIVSTPGAEPRSTHGYSAAVLLDAAVSLNRPDLRAAEESVRRWSNTISNVRAAEDGGTVLVVGPATSAALQSLVRADPIRYAERELQDRQAAGFPPASKLITVDGPPASVRIINDELILPPGAQIMALARLSGEGDDEIVRLTLRAELSTGKALTKEVKRVLALRSARKDPGGLRVHVDPFVLG